MLVTDLEHIEQRAAMSPGLKKAVGFLKSNGVRNMADGRVDIAGDRVFAIVQRYETLKPEGPKFEFHEKYIDLQCIISGEEIIGWAPLELMTITEGYNDEKDIAFGTVAQGKWTPVKLQAGQIAMLWPEDAHAPKLAVGNPSPVMKIVIKIAV